MMALEAGTMLLHYRLEARLGEGAMGVVWKATDTILGREVAVKILPAALAGDPDRLARFDREARTLASLNHPNIAAIYGLHEAGGVHFLAMELVRGRTLTEELAQGLAPARVIALGAAIAEAVAAAHRQHVTHRDLKPDNIMVDLDGRPKVLDFGLATPGVIGSPLDATRSMMTQEGSVLGTLSYMSPEQAQGRPVDARSDVFSLGIVLFEMATGQRPFGGDSAIAILSSILRDPPPPLLKLAPAVPPKLDRIIRRCLEKSAHLRYPDASALQADLEALRDELASRPGGAVLIPRPARNRLAAAAAIALILLAALGLRWQRRYARERWARSEGLPRLEAIIDRIQGLEEGRESWDAYILARQIEAASPGEPGLARLWGKFTRELTLASDPPGALVLARYYDEPAAPPLVLGRTPLEHVRYPRGFTRVQLTLAGHEPLEDVVWNFPIGEGATRTWRFPAPGEVPPSMSYVPAGAFEMFMPGLDHLKAEPMRAFAMDRHEVTNSAFKAFVDAGGYREAKYWKQPFVAQGHSLSFQEAIARFTDRTGRTGPATWEVGTFPEGRGDYPVAGVSWYEAAAYAEWAGKSLPTIFHWNRVAFTVGSSRIVPLANMGGTGPVPVGSTQSMNRFGVSDLAGNVREWTWNPSGSDGGHFILGGGWNDPDYAFNDAYAQQPFDRSVTNGFRCIRYLEPEPNLATLQQSIERPLRAFKAEKPAPDGVFAQYLRQFSYDRTPLEARIEEENHTPGWVRQKITFNAAYGGERMMAYLFLPTAGKPPYQVVVNFPGSGSIDIRSSANLEPGRIDFIVKSGRALLWPIYKGTYERGGDLHTDYPSETASYRDYMLMWGKDLSRSIDYVETRPDLDAGRLAYFGLSWGAAMGAILPAVEKRIKVNILYVAGLELQHALPEVDAVNYIGRVKQPTLMLNGENDFFFPSETSQKPMFELLGTPPAQKKRLVFPGGHSVPRMDLIRESLAWLDKYLGPV